MTETIHFELQQFARDIKIKRTVNNKISLRDLSKKLGISHSSLSRIENEKNIPDTLTYFILCRWMKEDMSYYLTVKINKDESNPRTV